MYHFTLLFHSRRGYNTKYVRATPEGLQAEIDYLAANGCWGFELTKAVAL